MLWIIDPDVFIGSKHYNACIRVLDTIVSQIRSHEFVVDNDTVKHEYLQFWKENRSDPELSSIKILTYILDSSSLLCKEISSEYDEFNDVIAQLQSKGYEKSNHLEAVEPNLLAMFARAEAFCPALLLPGERLAIRKRALHDVTICRQAKMRVWNRLDVRYASDTPNELPPPLIEKHAYIESQRFELESALALQTVDPVRCEPSPSFELFGEQIDVYGRKTENGTLVVVVGECKLREEGNEIKLVDDNALVQVERKAIAVEKYLRVTRKIDNFRVERHIFSNAEGLNHKATTEFDRMRQQGIAIYFWKATLTSGWSRKTEWKIEMLQKVE